MANSSTKSTAAVFVARLSLNFKQVIIWSPIAIVICVAEPVVRPLWLGWWCQKLFFDTFGTNPKHWPHLITAGVNFVLIVVRRWCFPPANGQKFLMSPLLAWKTLKTLFPNEPFTCKPNYPGCKQPSHLRVTLIIVYDLHLESGWLKIPNPCLHHQSPAIKMKNICCLLLPYPDYTMQF